MAWAGGPDGASNDPEDYHPDLTLRNGYPILYDCSEELVAPSFHNVTVSYDYEIRMAAGVDFTETLRHFEWSVLWNTAQDMGFLHCDFEGQPFGARRLRHRNLEETMIFILGSDAIDYLDTETGTCTIDAPANQDGTVCYPMKGEMHGVYTGGTASAVENFFLDTVETVMGTSLVHVTGVESVSFIGERSDGTQGNEEPEDATRAGTETSSASSEGQSSLLYIGVAVGVAVLFLSVVVAFVLRKRRRIDDSKTKDLVEIEKEVESTGFTDSEILTDYSIPSDVEIPSGVENEDTTIPTEQEEANPTVETETPPVPIEVAVQQSEAPVHEKPPRSGRPRPVPIATQRRRRKKKKKRKKRVLQPVDKMESITEENEADVENESDCDSEWSEYSTDDEENIHKSLSRSSSSNSLLSDDSPPISPTTGMIEDSPPRKPLTEANLNAIAEVRTIRPLPPPWV